MEFRQFNEEYGRLYKEDDSLYRRLARHFGLSESSFWILYSLEASSQPLTQADLRYPPVSFQILSPGNRIRQNNLFY